MFVTGVQTCALPIFSGGAGGDGGLRVGVGGDEHRVGVEVVPEAVCGAEGDVVRIREVEAVLQSEVELIAMDADGILLGDGVDIRVVAADGERAVVVAPKVRAVDTNGEAFEELCADAEIHLPHAARAGMCLGGCGGRCAHGGGGRVVVADIAERYYTETAAHVFHQSECGDGIFEISVVGVELTVAFLVLCGWLP